MRVSHSGRLRLPSKQKSPWVRIPLPAHSVSVSSDESQLRGLGGQKASDSTHFLAPWLNGYNAGLSRRVVWIRIPVEPPKRNNLCRCLRGLQPHYTLYCPVVKQASLDFLAVAFLVRIQTG